MFGRVKKLWESPNTKRENRGHPPGSVTVVNETIRVFLGRFDLQVMVIERGIFCFLEERRYTGGSCWALNVRPLVDGETAREELYRRLEQRDQSGERHPGHETTNMIKEIDRYLDDGAYGPLGVGEALIRVDTTDLERVEYVAVVSAVKTKAGL